MIARIKKLFLLSTLYFLLSTLLCGCGNQYSAEKLYWRASQTAKEIIQNRPLDKLTAEERRKIIAGYRRVVEKYPLEPLAARSGFMIAQIYILQEQYSQAKEELVKITQNFSRNGELASQAQFMIGNLYERQGDWQQAISEYEKVTDLFPLSSIGLKTPIYVAEYYKRNKNEAQANKAYDRALKHYQKIINEYSGTSMVAAVKDYSALAYVSQGNWDAAVDVWQTIVNEYPQTQIGAGSLFAIGETYLREIKDLEKAIEVYEGFVENNPTSKIIRHAKFQIGRLYFIKEDFSKARQVLEEIIRDYPQEIALCTNARLAVAACYERQGNWDKASQAYDKLKSDYPDSRVALGVPLFIAQHYLKENKVLEAESAFKEAVSGYKKLIKENREPELAVEAQDFISLAYISQQRWDEAIDSLKASVDAYPENPRVSTALFTIASIYQKQLAAPEKAIEIFEKFIAQYPRHVLAGLAKSEIDALQKSIKQEF
ncbi:MAG: tetratricopeptide repeat protein [Candidatus Omnitrophica bacterium]|nr:tetratricopeptide repeat protein [Candidatus Omnitrophota bacterium]